MIVEGVWWIGRANRYRNRADQGCFATPVVHSSHDFGWDRISHAFVIRDNHGIAGYVLHRLLVPVELAEAFLAKCAEQAFNDLFLVSQYPVVTATAVVEAAGTKLKVDRGKAIQDADACLTTLPGLSLSLIEDVRGQEHLFLFDSLRKNFGAHISGMRCGEIRRHMRA